MVLKFLREGKMKKVISILGLLILLAGSVFFDRLFNQLERWIAI